MAEVKIIEKKKKVSWCNKMYLINEKCNLKNLIYYHKGNVVQAPLEALLTFYLVESLVFLTNIFFEEPLSAIEMIPVIFIPLIFALLVCIIYSVIGIYFFQIGYLIV